MRRSGTLLLMRVLYPPVALVAALGCGPGLPEGRAPAAAPARSAEAEAPTAPAVPPRAIAAEPAPAALAPPPPGAAIGPGGPVVLVAADPERRWIALCRAENDSNGDGRVAVSVSPQGGTTGDRLSGFLVSGTDEPEPIDAFVGSDPTGRFVALVKGGELVLRNTTTRMATNLSALGADVRDDLASFVHPRAGAFDATGKRFLYLRRDGNVDRVVVRELETGAEVVIDALPGETYRADFDPSSEWIVMSVLSDTDGNGRAPWPAPEAKAPHMRCDGPLPRYATWERPRDEPRTFVVRVAGGTPREAPGLVTPFGDDLVLRDADGTLARVSDDGKRTLLSRRGCASRLLHADVARRALLFTCTEKPGRHGAVLVGPAGPKDLGLTLAAAAGDHVVGGAPRLVPLHPGADAVLLDLDTGNVDSLRSGDRILATSGTHALALRGRSLVVHELGGSETVLPGTVDPFGRMRHSGFVHFVPPFVVDLSRGSLLGTSDARALAVANDGLLLVASGGSEDATRFSSGPLTWVAPSPAP